MKNNSNISDYKFVVLGKIIHTDFFIKQLRKYGFPKPLVIVSLDNEYHRDERLLKPYGLYSQVEDLAREGLCDLYKMKSVNCDEAISLFDQYKSNVGISINCRNIIKKRIIDYFGGKIFNLHDSYLPNERGGALNTWRILNGINEVGNTIHYLEEGIDSGPLVVQKRTKINKKLPESIDYLEVEKDNCEIILAEFVELLMGNEVIPAIVQENDKSLYYPRLFTEINGIIDWDWDIESVEKFIRGFGSPYPGAYTYYRDKKVHILECSIDRDIKETFHPFSNGKVVTVLDNMDVRVIAGCRALIVKKISVDGTQVRSGEILSTKYTFHSPMDELLKAKLYVPTTLSMNKSEEKYNE
jgi:methionyl-tRNA formyltransferase